MDPDEFVVTSYVYQRFTGQSYSTYTYNGATYYAFGNALNERWVDVDGDRYWDYGLRDEGNGNWSRHNGFYWDHDEGAPPTEGDGTGQDELPQGGLAELFAVDELSPPEPVGHSPLGVDMRMFQAEEWFL